ncbi:MAG TPA: hypothetical protein DDZ89_12670 [Clostridiales bacterium]|nr:hypothetical protein [Clostridiales bacterium]
MNAVVQMLNSLSGGWSGHRECRIQPNWLLIYHTEAGGFNQSIQKSEFRMLRVYASSSLLISCKRSLVSETSAYSRSSVRIR